VREEMHFKPKLDCPFCKKVSGNIFEREHGTVVAFADIYPVTPGHMLIIPRRHTPDYFEMTSEEHHDTVQIILALKEQMCAENPEISGFNIGVNCGISAGQTVFHAHTHLIPRRDGDTKHPRGGVRGIIPRKQSYL
jgi:diadenosine tetraphosphate (Ap4A) HIT family hydrolase